MADNVIISNNGASSNPDYTLTSTDVSGAQIQHTAVVGIQAVRIDKASSSITYYGFAKAGVINASALWRIIRHTTTNPQALEFADGDALFDNVWDNRASLSYS